MGSQQLETKHQKEQRIDPLSPTKYATLLKKRYERHDEFLRNMDITMISFQTQAS